ncbi:hypothetical protein TNCV_62111 [Trichonephila clavipes]|nr:hypothetical protein TNCV_62111 [Trichonephila clavipes]
MDHVILNYRQVTGTVSELNTSKPLHHAGVSTLNLNVPLSTESSVQQKHLSPPTPILIRDHKIRFHLSFTKAFRRRGYLNGEVGGTSGVDSDRYATTFTSHLKSKFPTSSLDGVKSFNESDYSEAF